MKLAILFPGQGAQFVSMGKTFYDNFAESKAVFDRADEYLGFSISKLCFEGPEDALSQTKNAQPAIFVTGLSILAALQRKFPELTVSATCGLSLGEFTALVYAGSLDFETGLKLVQKRGEWMQMAGDANPGTMCSIMGLPVEACETIAQEAGVQVANYNSPEQTVLSGTVAGIEKAISLAESKKAKRVLQLKVSGAFHSRLMSPAQTQLQELLQDASIKLPRIDFLSNVSGTYCRDIDEIRNNLGKQVTHSVRWRHSINQLQSDGYSNAIELGPNSVLKGLVRKITRDIKVQNIDEPADLGKIADMFNESTLQ